jgi:imidazolonepropionase-like amidohydrolase
MVRWHTPVEVLKMATADNAELLALSGRRSLSAGKLGFMEDGALADVLLGDGDSIANLKLIEDAAKNFVVIKKAGTICKNTLKSSRDSHPFPRLTRLLRAPPVQVRLKNLASCSGIELE